MLDFAQTGHILQAMKKKKYDMKESLDIAESVVTILMFVMAVWGSIVSFEEGFWGKLNHVVNHLHEEYNHLEHRVVASRQTDKYK